MFKIDGREIPVQSAELVAQVDSDTSFSLYVQSQEPLTGMSLDNIRVGGTSVAGANARMAEDGPGGVEGLEVNVAGQSWFVRRLSIRVGTPRDNLVHVEATAACAPCDGSQGEHAVKFEGDAEFSLETERI